MIILIIVFSIISSYHIILYLQQSSYHLASLFKYYKKEIKKLESVLLLIPCIYLFFESIYILFLAILSLLFYLVVKYKNKFILKLKFTFRIRRIIVLYLFVIFLFIILNNKYLIFSLLLFNPLIIYIVVIFLLPIEKIIQMKFIKKSKKKIKEINPIVVGITGSAGKTTTKNIIAFLLKDDFLVFKTPKSYNTVNGISKSINEDMHYQTEICVIEYGASHINDIKKSLNLIKPNISIITNIKNQHLETFKTLDNILKEKTKIIEGSLIHIRTTNANYTVDKKIHEVVVDLGKANDANFQAINLEYLKNGMEFDLIDNDSKTCIHLKTSLLGRFNVLNILFGIAVLKYLRPGIKDNELIYRIGNIPPVENRLELLNVGDKVIINDSFNSNLDGFLEALNILSVYEGEKIIITPGVVSGNIEEANKIIASKIKEMNVFVFLVESIASYYFLKILDNFEKVNSFKEAYEKALKSKANVILIENDITDIYKR